MTIVEEFLDGLIETNRSHSFFVNWPKVNKYRELFNDELILLSSVSNSEIDPAEELERLIRKYPRIICLLPLLVAVRPKNNVLPVIDELTLDTFRYDFNVSKISEVNIKRALSFAERTGLLPELSTIKNPYDYYFGVEVGLDTNGRKNRSGSAMEVLIEPFARELAEKYNGKFLKQTNFEIASKHFGVGIPKTEANKRGDFMLLIQNIPINIEVNFFDGGGSKQEIMNSYIPRAENLKEEGWRFALVTDGKGWLTNKNQVELGFNTIKYIFNTKMCKEGALDRIIE